MTHTTDPQEIVKRLNDYVDTGLANHGYLKWGATRKVLQDTIAWIESQSKPSGPRYKDLLEYFEVSERLRKSPVGYPVDAETVQTFIQYFQVINLDSLGKFLVQQYDIRYKS